MRHSLLIGLTIFLFGCGSNNATVINNEPEEIIMISQSDLSNEKIKNYSLLSCMYRDSYFPVFLVDKCKNILLELCGNIEKENPSDLDQLYKLTHSATRKINDLENEFFANGSEIETVARECFGENFEFIAIAYGFDADREELISPRTW